MKGVTKICELRFASAFLAISRLDRISGRIRMVAVSNRITDRIEKMPTVSRIIYGYSWIVLYILEGRVYA